MDEKNLLITCDDLSVLGGSIITTIRFANALSKIGWNVVILTCNSNAIEELDPKIKIEFATWFFFVPGGKNAGKIGGFSFFILNRIIRKYNINVTLASNLSLLGWAAMYVSNFKNIPTFSLCSAQVENGSEGYPVFLKKIAIIILEFLMRIHYSAAWKILPQSKFSADILKRYTSNENIQIISNGVNTSTYKILDVNDIEKVKLKYHISNDYSNLVFLGRMAKEKCLPDLFRAIQILINTDVKVHLFLIGNGPYKDELINLSRFYGIEHNISFLGYLPINDVVAVLNAVDYYVHPSQIELEGMSLLEAMACGRPIIVSDSELSASKQFVSGNGITYRHGDPHDLAQKILKMVELDNESYQKLSNKSIEIADSYSFENSVKLMDKALRESGEN